jgi:D-amino-acid dehydrogenase
MRVIVVGSGIVGASAAYHLAKADVDVVVVDRADEGQATAAGAGIVAPWPSPDTTSAMAALGLRAATHYPQLIEELLAEQVNDPGYARVGGILLADEGPVLEARHEGLLAQRREPSMSGLGDVERLQPGEPAARFPALRPDLAGLWVGGIARVNGRALREALLQAAWRRTAQRRSGSAALMLTRGRACGVTLDDEAVEADAVVVAAGAWSGALCQPLGVALPVFPQRGQILHLDLPDQHTGAWPAVLALGDHYLVGFPGGRVVAGATRESDSGFDYRATAAGLHRVLTDALSIAPGLAGGSMAEVRVGFRPLSPDGVASLGAIDSLPGLVVATGLGAVGLTLGPYLGAVAGDIVLGREPALDLTPYRPDRPQPATDLDVGQS